MGLSVGFFGNFFNRAYYGNDRKGDFRPEDLPDTRFKLFFELIKLRWTKLIQLSFQMTLFFAPMLIWLVMNVTALGTALMEDSSNAALTLHSYLSVYLAINIPLTLIGALGLAGSIYVLQKWALDDQADAWPDFWVGIRQNWKQALSIGLLSSLAVYVGYFAIRFYGEFSSQNMFLMLPMYLCISMMVLLAMMSLFFYPLMVTYELKLRHLIKNAFLLSLARLPFTLLMTLLTALPVIATLVFPQIMGFVILFYVLFGFSFFGLMHCVYANGTFDRYINPNIPGAPLRKGMAPEKPKSERKRGGQRRA